MAELWQRCASLRVGDTAGAPLEGDFEQANVPRHEPERIADNTPRQDWRYAALDHSRTFAVTLHNPDVGEPQKEDVDPRSGELTALIESIPEGWTRARIAGQSWGITRTTRAGGKVISLDAERLGDTEQLGANVWITSEGALLRPCEVPAEKVWQFLRAAATALTA